MKLGILVLCACAAPAHRPPAAVAPAAIVPPDTSAVRARLTFALHGRLAKRVDIAVAGPDPAAQAMCEVIVDDERRMVGGPITSQLARACRREALPRVAAGGPYELVDTRRVTPADYLLALATRDQRPDLDGATATLQETTDFSDLPACNQARAEEVALDAREEAEAAEASHQFAARELGDRRQARDRACASAKDEADRCAKLPASSHERAECDMMAHLSQVECGSDNSEVEILERELTEGPTTKIDRGTHVCIPG